MAHQTYLNFDLSLLRLGDSYQAEVTDSPAGQAACDFKLPFTEAELASVQPWQGDRVRHFLLAPPSTPAATPSLTVQAFGERLFAASFGREVATALLRSLDAAARQDAGLRIRLRMDASVPELAELPWEYLYIPALARFPALSTQLSIVRYVKLNQPEKALTLTPPLQVLVVIAAPQDLLQLDVEQEWRRIEQATASLQAQGLLRLERLAEATLPALRQRLRAAPVHILHFIGHGFFEPQQDLGGLLFVDERGRSQVVSAEMLATRLHDHATLRLVLLNACEGGRSDRDAFFAGVAQKLVQQGLPAVIAMQFPISDRAAVLLAQEFYQTLALGYPVDTALDEARKAIYEQDADHFEWGAPVLFMRADDGLLFDMDLLPNTQTQPSPAPTPPFSPRWRGKLPVTAAVGVLSVILILFVYWPWSPGPSAPVATPAAKDVAATVAATSSPPPSATVAPTVAIYAWLSPTPVLPEQVTIAVAPLVACVAAPDIRAALRNELTQQLADSTTTIDIIQIETPSDITAAQEMMIAQAIQVLIWGRCRDDGQAELQVQLNGLPPPMDELLFEPEQLDFVALPAHVRQFALAATFYAVARYDLAEAALAALPAPARQDASATDRLWLGANVAAHREIWSAATVAFADAIGAGSQLSDVRQIYLHANLGLVQREAALASTERVALCAQDPATAYTTAISLTKALDLPADDLPLLYAGRGFANFSCPKADDKALFTVLYDDAAMGAAVPIPYGLALHAMVDLAYGDYLSTQSYACATLKLAPDFPIAHLALGRIYGQYESLRQAAMHHLEQYGQFAHFGTQRQEALRRLNGLAKVALDPDTPPGLGTCN
ncbi:MAG: CHAT domain-containing protein [Caldilineaceae bacterium]